jgi:hypothetical protein
MLNLTPPRHTPTLPIRDVQTLATYVRFGLQRTRSALARGNGRFCRFPSTALAAPDRPQGVRKQTHRDGRLSECPQKSIGTTITSRRSVSSRSERHLPLELQTQTRAQIESDPN